MAHSRLLAFARKPAPIQVAYLGYPHTTGLRAMDYKLTDAHVDPVGAFEKFHTEQLIRLPQTWFCCEGEPTAPPVNELPARTNGYVTFSSLNTLMKVTPPVIDAWSRVLHEVANSTLMLVTTGLASAGTRQRIEEKFAARGVAKHRLVLEDLSSVGQGLHAYHRADISLDAFPYSGGTTSVNSLWMGVPLVTLAANTPVGRQGVSLNRNLGLDDLIAESVDDYVAAAVRLARDVDRLANLRATLRERMLASAICDGRTFVRHLEDAYRLMTSRFPDPDRR